MDLELERECMVKEQIMRRGILEPHLLSVLRDIPRHLFGQPIDWSSAYEDHPLQIGESQTISQPFIVALMTSLLSLQGDENVLDVGTGSGYQAAILGRMARVVHSVEYIPSLAECAGQVLQKVGITNVIIHVGDGSQGWIESAPYNAILVAAAAPAVPQPLLDQLAEGGRMVIPVGNKPRQELQVWKRVGDHFEYEANIPVVFVPLRGDYGWKEGQWG